MAAIDSLSDEERHRFLRVTQDALHIDRHFHLYLWLRADLQYFLPHEILVSVSGDIGRSREVGRRRVAWDVVSALPGVNTANLFKCGLDEVATHLCERWQQNERRCLVLEAESIPLLADGGCGCAIHKALRGMRTLVVHGIRDERTGQDTLYLFLHAKAGQVGRHPGMVDLLMPHIDHACRRIACLRPAADSAGEAAVTLSPREIEILDWVGHGKTNSEIGTILNISGLTAKNHLQRIFRKLHASNRAQAVAKWRDLSRAAGSSNS